jgi:hypothetical protein
MNWKLRPASPLEQEIAALKTTIALLKHDLSNKEQFVDRLEFLLRSRLSRIDDLTGRLEAAHAQIRKLDEENDHLAELAKG